MNENPLDQSLTPTDEIDLVKIYKIIERNKKLIAKLSTIAIILSSFYSITRKNIYQGQFEIVIGEKNKTSSILQNLNQLGFIMGRSNSKTLNTEVGILESGSVLMPIYEFVNNEKLKLNKDYESPNFSSWKLNSLDIILKKKTSILNIKYKDTNKEIIIPVLNKISKTYQNYSGKTQKRSYFLMRDYLDSQIAIYKKKSLLSKKNALEYAIDKNLSINDIKTKNMNFGD